MTKDQLEELQGADILVLIVFAQEDIRILVDALDITSPNVLFSVVEKGYILMNTKGVEKSWDTVF